MGRLQLPVPLLAAPDLPMRAVLCTVPVVFVKGVDLLFVGARTRRAKLELDKGLAAKGNAKGNA